MNPEPFFINNQWFLACGVHEIGPRPKRVVIAEWYWNQNTHRWARLYSAGTAFQNEQDAAAYLAANREHLESALGR